MNSAGGGVNIFWVLVVVGSAVAGLVVGLRHAWWFALLGVVVPVSLLVASRFVSNASLNGEGDFSWQTVLVFLAAFSAFIFYVSLTVGASAGALGRLWRDRRSPGSPAG